jgi:rhamnose utilization protein RhaD (predicted bifunctional aldolase and dehydrogenase)
MLGETTEVIYVKRSGCDLAATGPDDPLAVRLDQ